MPYPAKFKYTKEHEWVEINGDTGTVGITDYAQNSLGDIVFVDLPKVGARVQAGKVFGSVESVKAVSDLYAPVTGEVVEVNEELSSAPEKVNSAPHEAWMVRVKLEGEPGGDGQPLMDSAEYEAFVADEGGH